ncbi:Hypothetical protein NGAL_HAMBI2566_48360 [Neorhizobium galegae bv. orientalis]|nr:Hypothetical protein NGAL_HAMBI2566_48360 [Neorhizobium galegae bv. orientalis]
MKTSNGITVIAAVTMVLIERDRIRHLIGLGGEVRGTSKIGDEPSEIGMELSDRGCRQRKRGSTSVAAGSDDCMVMKVEHNLGCQGHQG